MKKIAYLIITILLLPSCETGPDDPILEYSLKTAKVIDTNNDFGLSIFREIATSEQAANILISPASVSLALGMAYNGSETTTKEAFEEVLNYNGLTRAEVNEINRDLIKQLVTNQKGNLLEIANSVWYRSGFQVYEAFLQLNQDYFDAEVKELDFDGSDAVSEINKWVADKTHDKIDKIIEQLSPESMMLLINALYFNCLWETEFDPDETSTETFYNSDLTAYGEVEMMTTETAFNVAQNEEFSAVELPYKNEKFSMFLFLPNSGSTPDDLIEELDGESWKSYMGEFTSYDEVQVTMPKFKFEYQRQLRDDLNEMGLGVAFTDAADFSSISATDLLISEVIHKTYIDVNEEGTEAAAVTAVVFETTSVGGDGGPLVLRFDRPFLFAITENASKSIVFIGKLEEPEYE